MSDIIQLLPDSVANQIAAGEVIQRPASVIKELVENAIDAGATSIDVLVVDAGRTSIQVIDNGKGMSETDARMSFERHATSKIRKADDLFALHTMGFRGEALASIAAVAQVELRTRTADSELGTLVTISGSRITGQEPVSCTAGSNFMVKNLFFNVPARRKFLKTNATELNNIMTAYERIVLVYPDINFTLHSNGSELLCLRSGSLRQRIADVFGKRFNHEILPVNVDTTLCRINGFVGRPEAARKKGVHEYFFVNGRYMKHPFFHKAVMSAYDRLIPQGLMVPYFIYFEVNPADIDVNIHPTKTEIKFENEQAIWQILAAAVKDAIGQFCEIPSIDFDTEGKPDIPVFDPNSGVAPPSPSYNPNYNPFRQTPSVGHKAPANWEQLYDGLDNKGKDNDTPTSPDLFGMDEPVETAGDKAVPAQGLTEERSPVHYQYKGRYIMTAVKSGLMIIDQHRADIRVRYERYLAMFRSRVIESQRVLFPEAVQFPPSDTVLVGKLLPELSALGFELTDLGHNSYAINGVPAGLDGIDHVSLLTSMVADAAERGVASCEEINHSLALSMARSAAVPQGQVLSNGEMESIVNELFACSNVNHTPDGKPILCILPQQDIEQLLG
jgi:DNA mismatch repair protein MutL